MNRHGVIEADTYGPQCNQISFGQMPGSEKEMGAGDYEASCWMWEHRADRKEAEGCCIERATASDYIHNQMSKQVTNTVT